MLGKLDENRKKNVYNGIIIVLAFLVLGCTTYLFVSHLNKDGDNEQKPMAKSDLNKEKIQPTIQKVNQASDKHITPKKSNTEEHNDGIKEEKYEKVEDQSGQTGAPLNNDKDKIDLRQNPATSESNTIRTDTHPVNITADKKALEGTPAVISQAGTSADVQSPDVRSSDAIEQHEPIIQDLFTKYGELTTTLNENMDETNEMIKYLKDLEKELNKLSEKEQTDDAALDTKKNKEHCELEIKTMNKNLEFLGSLLNLTGEITNSFQSFENNKIKNTGTGQTSGIKEEDKDLWKEFSKFFLNLYPDLKNLKEARFAGSEKAIQKMKELNEILLGKNYFKVKSSESVPEESEFDFDIFNNPFIDYLIELETDIKHINKIKPLYRELQTELLKIKDELKDKNIDEKSDQKDEENTEVSQKEKIYSTWGEIDKDLLETTKNERVQNIKKLIEEEINKIKDSGIKETIRSKMNKIKLGYLGRLWKFIWRK